MNEYKTTQGNYETDSGPIATQTCIKDKFHRNKGVETGLKCFQSSRREIVRIAMHSDYGLGIVQSRIEEVDKGIQ